MKTFLFLFTSFITTSFGLTIFHAVDSSEMCPGNLRVTSRSLPDQKDTIEYSIQFETESATKTKATAFLRVLRNSEFIARVSISPKIKGKSYTFIFQMAREGAKESRLTLSTYLCDDRGLAVIGGGQVFEIKLGGFLPVDSKIID